MSIRYDNVTIYIVFQHLGGGPRIAVIFYLSEGLPAITWFGEISVLLFLSSTSGEAKNNSTHTTLKYFCINHGDQRVFSI